MKQRALCRAFLKHGTEQYISRQCVSSSLVAPLPAHEGNNDHEELPTDIPGPPALPVIGTIYKYLPGGEYHGLTLTSAMMKKYQKYGAVVREEVYPGFVVVWMFDPDDIAHAHRCEEKYPCRPPLEFAVKYMKSRRKPISVAHLQGEAWHNSRKAIQQHLLRPRAVSGYVTAQASVADDFVRRMRMLMDKDGEIPDYLNELYKWAMESGGMVCFNKRIGALAVNEDISPDVQKFVDATNDTFAAMHKLVFGPPLYKLFETPAYKKYCRNMDLIWEISSKYIQETLDGVDSNSEPALGDCLLVHMLRNQNMTYEQVVGMATSLLFAGIDTTAHTLAFNIYQLAVNQPVQNKLYEEITQMAPLEGDMNELGQRLNDMPYLKAVVKETSRLMPTVSVVLRKLQKDLLVKGYRIPAGNHVMFAHGVISHLKEYFDQPESFLPERWLREGAEQPAHHPFAVMPFSHGPRMCLGRRVAEQEIYLAIVRLIQNFRIEYHHEPIGVATRVVNTPDKPLRFKFIERR